MQLRRVVLTCAVCLTVGMPTGPALAENAERGSRGRSNADRLAGATSVWPLADGFVSLGGSSLRYLPPGAKRWTSLHRVIGDNLYRLGLDPKNERVLAMWEKDPDLHLLSVRTGEHVRLPKPPKPVPRSPLSQLHSLAFTVDGKSALVFMNSFESPRVGTIVGWRLALDGSGKQEELFRTEGALLVGTGPYGAVVAYPMKGGHCTPRYCRPGAANVVAFELTGGGIVQRTLLTEQPHPVEELLPVRTEDPDVVAWELKHGRKARSLLIYTPSRGSVEHVALPVRNKHGETFGRSLLRREPRELLFFESPGKDLELQHHPLDGKTAPYVTRIGPNKTWDNGLYGFGVRRNGALWMHWGDYLVQLDERGRVTGYPLEPLLSRRTEWAGAALYSQATDSVWIGIEAGPGRNQARVRFAHVDKRAKPWQQVRVDCEDLPDVDALMRWPVKSHATCSGGRTNPRAPKPEPLDVLLDLPDGTRIIKTGPRSCVRIVEKPCTKK